MTHLFIGNWSGAILIVTNLAQTANIQQRAVIKKGRCKGELKKLPTGPVPFKPVMFLYLKMRIIDFISIGQLEITIPNRGMFS